MDEQKTKTQTIMKTTKNYEVNYRKMCWNGYRFSRRIWWIRMFNHLNTLPALLMNYQWSRKHKWYRVRASIVSALTSRKAEIVTPSQWIQSYPCESKTSQETQKSLQKFLEPTRKPTVIYTDNSLEFGKSCENFSWKSSYVNAT